MNAIIFASTTLSTLSTTFGLFAVAFGFIGFVGGAVGYFAKGRNDAIIKAQAELIDVRDKQISDLKQENASLSSENKVLAQSNDVLKGLAQGSPQIKALSKKIEDISKFLKGKKK